MPNQIPLLYDSTTGLAKQFGAGDTITQAIAPGDTCQAPGTEVVQTSGFTATMRQINQVNTTSGAITVTPPSSPAIGDRFAVVDARATAATNNITVDFDTANQKLYGTEQNYVINVNGGFAEFIYMGTSTGWVATKG